MTENIILPPFTPKYLEEEKQEDKGTVFTVRLNNEEIALLTNARRILRQPKDSTCLKQLALIGYKSITEPKTEALIETIFSNKRKNERLGINVIE